MKKFEIISDYKPSGDQPSAIKKFAMGLKKIRKIKFFLVLLVPEKHLQSQML